MTGSKSLQFWLMLLLTGCLIATQQAAQADDEPVGHEIERAALIQIDGPIGPRLQAFLDRKLDEARANEVDLVILKIDSPGGYLHTTNEIVDRIRDLPWADTVAYIPREALSGAAIVALACDEIVMHPSARLGDAGPIFQGEDALFRHAPQKVRSDLAVRVRDLAEAKGRSPALCESMIDLNVIVHEVQHRETMERRFMSDNEIESTGEADSWEKLAPVFESREDTFLTVTGTRAVELGLADSEAEALEDLRDRYGWSGDLLILKPTAVDTTVFVLNLPAITFLLLIIGLIALYVEFSAPGIGVGGLVALLCFALFFWSRLLGGTAGWLEVILFLAGVTFVLTEIFIIPGFGIAGISGLLLMSASVLLASQDFVIPNSPRQVETTLTAVSVLAGSCVAFIVIAIVMTKYMGYLPVLNRLALEPPSGEGLAFHENDRKSEASADEYTVAVGDWGIAESTLRPAGKATFAEKFVDVVTDGSFIDQGQQVRVIEVSGNRVVVRAVDSNA